MKNLLKLALLLLNGEKKAFAQGMALSLTVLIMGIALLSLSGWFITAAAAAGLIGLGTVFNVFGPSAMVRFLALGRTVARYGERLTTHDATLRALSNLRIRLLNGVLHAPYRQLERLRASVFLNRVTADIDALDGLALRLLIPGIAGLAVIALTAIAVGLLVDPSIALVILIGYGFGPTFVFLVGQSLAQRPSRRNEAGMQALRSRVIDLITVREELIAFGRIRHTQESINKAIAYQSHGQNTVEKIERQTGFCLEMMGWGVVALSLALGASLTQSGSISAAQAAIGVFAALALSEAVAPVRRALAEIGQMRSAAKRVIPLLADADVEPSNVIVDGTDAPLVADALVVKREPIGAPLFAPLSFRVRPGETVALTGRSGSGKSTVLLMVVGQITPSDGKLSYKGSAPHLVPTEILTHTVAMVPQRHALVAGTIAENLRLAAPAASDGDLWDALEATQLADVIRAKGGMDSSLGFRGVGLSGGEARRLVLARAILRKPALLLLDEPTEGLDAPLANVVLAGLRQALPDAAFLIAAHRPEEVAFADEIIHVA
ncbi:ATP-binding cassette domain-containing protein [Octadecabacter sp. 1_MG-2023]|uniref:amino acid ABC transporter ATP-binding/permease protein n=1 Tax=unclassified Octadecabacter TaxID=196158 RepID=UPI001C0A5839|nr:MULTISPECIES: ATP-binding cassette domain-containing protein [unclassified Octadecabacter]MBU2993851.1 ATP-binding cassette domain-containing protein [Octadecabacter sp. B2R22]MDO6735303.1 ATP-binding cassette domain-containing protein [Octadecabacter sp. 1_MG-2023]